MSGHMEEYNYEKENPYTQLPEPKLRVRKIVRKLADMSPDTLKDTIQEAEERRQRAVVEESIPPIKRRKKTGKVEEKSKEEKNLIEDFNDSETEKETKGLEVKSSSSSIKSKTILHSSSSSSSFSPVTQKESLAKGMAIALACGAFADGTPLPVKTDSVATPKSPVYVVPPALHGLDLKEASLKFEAFMGESRASLLRDEPEEGDK
jgi:hypothetical protein